MKKLLFLISLMTCVLSGYSQKIAVHVEGEPLRSLLTEEQKQTMDTPMYHWGVDKRGLCIPKEH